MDFELARSTMIKQQLRAWEVLNPDVLDTLSVIPRERFVPEDYLPMAFADTMIPLDDGQVMLAPKIEGRMIQALELTDQDRVLEVGTGSGFLTACLARLAGHVHSVDIREAFVQAAQPRIEAMHLRNFSLETRDASRLDWVKERYDAIVVTGSMPVLEDSFLQALAIGGRLLVTLGRSPVMETLLITRVGEDDWRRESLFETDIPPLDNAYDPPHFDF